MLCFLLLSSESIFASEENHTDTLATNRLPELVVNAELPAVIRPQRLSGEQIENMSAHNVADAIRYFSGVQIKDYGGIGGVKTIDVRSMGSTHTGVFYDGIQLGNAQNGQIDLGKYSLDNIAEISLYNGQKSEIFQPARDFASASAIYINSRIPKFRPGKRFNTSFTFRTGSFGLVNPSLRLDYCFNDNVSATASAEYTNANGRYKFRYRKVFSDGNIAWDTTAVRRNGDIEALRIEGGLFGRINNGNWTIKAYYYDSEKGIPGAIVNNIWKTSQRQWDRNFFVQGRIQNKQSERYEWMVNAKYSHDRMRYLNPDTTLMYIDNKFLQQEFYLSTTHKFSIFPSWDLAVSADWQWNSLDATLVNFASPVRNSLLLSAATCFNWHGLKAQGALLMSYIYDRADLNDGINSPVRHSKSLCRLTPSLFMSWTPSNYTPMSMRAFIKRIFRMPTFNDLYYTDMGNANLKPESANQYDIGATWRAASISPTLGLLSFDLDAYYNLVSDKIIAVPKGTGQYRWMMMNIGKVRIFGLDAAASVTLTLPREVTLVGRLAYTFQRARDYSDPSDIHDAASTYRRQIAYIPLHSGSVTVEGEWRRLGLNYSFIYVGERYQNSSNIPVNYVQPWYTHDISAHYRLSIKNVNLKTTLEVNNLLNQQYEVIQNYPMPGRNFKLILNVEI